MPTRVALALASLTLAGTLISAQSGARAQDRQPPSPPPQQEAPAFKFRTGVELINVNATVTDQSGRFVSGLTRDDFRVYDDERLQTLSHFSAERVPVSLGIVLDTSGSMDGDKIRAARDALDRFLRQLLDADDEVFLYRFDNAPELVQDWTKDKRLVSDAVARIQPRGGTALYDAVAEAVQMAQQGRNRKKAVIIISDGNDTSSRTDIFAVKQLIRESEVLVYAIGVDTAASAPLAPMPQSADYSWQSAVGWPLASSQSVGSGGVCRGCARVQYPGGQGPRPVPLPFPMPGGRRPPAPVPPTPPVQPPQGPTGGSGGSGSSRYRNGGNDDRVNVAALRDITDDSGGRTEIIRFARDLDPATAGIADELSKQYDMGYAAEGPKDGRWHGLRVEVRNPAYRVRARRGYVAGK